MGLQSVQPVSPTAKRAQSRSGRRGRLRPACSFEPPLTNADTAIARALHADACRDPTLVAWVALWDLPAYPERYAARLATNGTLPRSVRQLLMQDPPEHPDKVITRLLTDARLLTC